MIKELFLLNKWTIIGASVLSLVSAALGVGVLSVVRSLLADIQNGDVASYSILSFGLLILVYSTLSLTSKYVGIRVGQKVVKELRVRLLRRILATPYLRLEQIGAHRIFTIMRNDVGALSKGILIIPSSLFRIATILFCFIYLSYISWQFSLILLTSILLILVFVGNIMKSVFALQTLSREQKDDYSNGLQTLVSGLKELKINTVRRRVFYFKQMVPLFSVIRNLTIKLNQKLAFLDTVLNSIVFLIIGVIIYSSLYWLKGLNVSDVVAAIMVLFYMTGSLMGLVISFGSFSESVASIRKLESLQLAEDSPSVGPENIKPTINDHTIITHQLTFDYSLDMAEGSVDTGDVFRLGPINAEFKSGEITFVTGNNGGGKSTFIKLVSGLYEPSSGVIRVGDVNVSSTYERELYAQTVSVIYSDFHLFDDFLDSFGEMAGDDVINKYLSTLGLNDKISATDGCVNVRNLSQGQKRRIALLSMLIEDRAICIFDEWAADQDENFKKFFYETLLVQLKEKNKTIIVVSHDSDYLHVADAKLHLEAGRMS